MSYSYFSLRAIKATCLSYEYSFCVHYTYLRSPTDFRLFISFVKPHRAVSSATISRWIKTVLSDAGIDTSIFKAHSVRRAATSAAYNKGVPVEHILKLANWSNESTFRRFYLKSAEPGMPDSTVNVVDLV